MEVDLSYFELFNFRQVQFIFVAGMVPWKDIMLPPCFETIHELNGFSKLDYAKELLNKAGNIDIKFEDDAIEYIFNAHKGCPRLLIESYSRVYQNALDKGLTKITKNNTSQIVDRIIDEMKFHEERMKSEPDWCKS